MPLEISVGPPIITINQGNTFLVSELNGEINADTELGVYSNDTRFISHYALSINGKKWHRLSSGAPIYYQALYYLSNPLVDTVAGEIKEGHLVLKIKREAGTAINEDLEICNYSTKPVQFIFELQLESDFADIFEVRSHKVVRRGSIVTAYDAEQRELSTRYKNKDFDREMLYRILDCSSPVQYANGSLTFEIALLPQQVWSAASRMELICGGKRRTDALADAQTMKQLHKSWDEGATRLTSVNEDVYRLYNQSISDLGGLRMFDHDFTDQQSWFPAAGVPWYFSLFGRDSLIIALQLMMAQPQLAIGTLQTLGEQQASTDDPYTDAEPGKILHELRTGELAHFKAIPHTPYFGSWDATPLYLVTLHESWKWLADDAFVKKQKDVALRCLDWIDKYGDIDGDGFQEYRTRSNQGYENMVWKDSTDCIIYPNGDNVPQPKAVCELQGYVFDAWVRMAELFDYLGDTSRSKELVQKALAMRERFEKAFWCPQDKIFALTLDPDKKAVPTVASNMGHLLWSGIATPEKAAMVKNRLMQDDMWTGWGMRTLSSDHISYNPHSYHAGSIWPHDNGIIAMGFKRYGYDKECALIARGISEAASHFQEYRLPELWAGIAPDGANFPVQYRGANIPQGWAAGTVFHLLQSILGLSANAPADELYVDPVLPYWMPELVLKGMKVGKHVIDLEFAQGDDEAEWRALKNEQGLKIIKRPFMPLLG
ncbi:MAG: amylo-alpha-1,6-glucosidase [Candidatus Melainabacteria bacterium]|nr:amylo-alpha-1,6-glucosidase [Candidatus Melainabacteria bacterium]